MNKKITSFETLVYYDGPEVVLVSDQISTKYVCALVVRGPESDKYFCTSISPSRLESFTSGSIDLRSIFDSSEANDFYTIELRDQEVTDIPILPIDFASLPQEWLPDEGFFLEPQPTEDLDLLHEATARNRAVIDLSLRPPESSIGNKISAYNLSQSVGMFQTLLKYAYKKSIAALSQAAKKVLDQIQNYEVEVLTFAPGSFKVRMQSKSPADLLGYTDISKALFKLDEIVGPIEDSEKSLDVLRRNAGHLIKAYQKFLKLAIDFNSTISYEWTFPELSKTIRHDITKRHAEPIYNLLEEKQDLGTEVINLVGRILKADVRSGVWTCLEEETNRTFTGKINPEREISLAGITLETTIYEFECEEHLVEEIVTGKEKTVLLLNKYKEKQ